ncbi:MAG: DUF2141 domain-containing protein [Methylotenera sp.]|nr:DUF2141 domain-containing protein [Oligoflexia bacterium]
MKIFSALVLSLMISGTSAFADEGTIHVSFNHLRNERGQILVSLYDSAEGFPNEARAALRTAVVPLDSGHPEITFENLPFGDYAIAVVHDENKNGKLDLAALGWPKEGYGASENPAMSRRSPRFDEAQFTVEAAMTELEIQLQYFHLFN